MNTATAAPVVDVIEEPQLRSVPAAHLSSAALMLNPQNMASMLAFAKLMASGKVTLPPELRNEGDCLAITMQSLQWGMNPFAVAQKTFLVSGKLGYEAQLVNAVINTMAPTKDRIHYEWYGPWDKVIGKFEIKKGDKGEYRVPGWKLADEDGIGVKVWATLKGEDEPRVLELLLAQARTRNSTLWADDPRQQLAYLGVKRWSRLYCPDVILGVYTPDELENLPEREINPLRQTGAQAAETARKLPAPANEAEADARAALITRLEMVAKEYGIEPYAEEWSKLTKQQRKMVGGDEHERLKGLAATKSPKPAPGVSDAAPADSAGATDQPQREPGADDA